MLVRGWTLKPTSSWITLDEELTLQHLDDYWRIYAWEDDADKQLFDAECQQLDSSLSLNAVMDIVASIIGPVSRPTRQGVYEVVGIDYWIRRNRKESKTAWYFVPNTLSDHPWNTGLYQTAELLNYRRFATRYSALVGLEEAIIEVAQHIDEAIPEELQRMMAGEPVLSDTSPIVSTSCEEQVPR